jgi:hypothetical protein
MSTRETPSRWRKSSFSQNGDCVEWAYGRGYVHVRDSSNAPVLALKFTYSAWQAFIADIKSGEANFQDEKTQRVHGAV